MIFHQRLQKVWNLILYTTKIYKIVLLYYLYNTFFFFQKLNICSSYITNIFQSLKLKFSPKKQKVSRIIPFFRSSLFFENLSRAKDLHDSQNVKEYSSELQISYSQSNITLVDVKQLQREFYKFSALNKLILQFYCKFRDRLLQKMATKNDSINQQSKVSIDQRPDSDRKLLSPEDTNHLQELIKNEENLKKSLASWNAMADGRLETISSCLNLFIFMMMLSLGGTQYSGPNTNGMYVLGWICIAQVSFFYLLVLLVKFIYLPFLERQLEKNNTQSFKLYNGIFNGKKQIKNLELNQLIQLQDTLSQRIELFGKVFPSVNPQNVTNQIKSTLLSRSNISYQNGELKNIKLKEKNAKYWQSFWQNFIIGKTFSIPGVILLVFIITPLSVATPKYTDEVVHNGQGFWATAFWGAGIFIFIIIKFFAWDHLNRNVEIARSDPFFAYHPVSIKHKQLKNLTLTQLEDIENTLINRENEFQTCFPNSNPSDVLSQVKAAILQKIPKRDQLVQKQIKEIINTEKKNQSLYNAWLNFFNLRVVVTIINALKYLIVVEITFNQYYPQTTEQLRKAKIAVGSMGLASFILGYAFYFFLRLSYLNTLEERVYEQRSSGFTTYRLVFFGNKLLKDLEVHQLQDIIDAINKRREQFSKCFSKIDIETLKKEIQVIINQKTSPFPNAQKVHHLLKNQAHARKMQAFWSAYADNALMTSMYSVYVLLVLLVISLCSLYDGVGYALGYVGVANLALIFLLVLFFKTFLIDRLTINLKHLKYLAITKQLNSIELAQLQRIQKIIETNPIEFRRCFPKANIQSTLAQLKQVILQKFIQKTNARIRNSEQQIRYQQLTIQLNRSKNALAAWTSMIIDRLYVYTPIAIVINILWVQTVIFKALYGVTVLGFLAVANVSLIAFLILLFHLVIRPYLEFLIRECEREIKFLQIKKSSITSEI